jgi:predicted aconitase with swiveling domain
MGRSEGRQIAARTLATGTAAGDALVLRAPLSFWGGIDSETGKIIDRSHPDLGACVTGRVLVMPGGRGSSSSSSVLAETLRRGTGPVALVLSTPDPILTVGAIVAHSLYGIRCPIVVCSTAHIQSGHRLRVKADGDVARLTVQSDE